MRINLSQHFYFVNPTEVGNDNAMIGVCPNPTFNKLNLLIMEKFENIIYELSDEKDIIIAVKAFSTKEESIDLIKYIGENFILRIYDDRKLLKSFQIRKVY